MSHSKYILEVSPTEMEAYLTVSFKKERSYEEDPTFPAKDEIVRYLRTSGVIHGLNLKAIERYAERGRFGETLQVAKGTYPVSGQGGRLEYSINISAEQNPKIDSNKFESIQSKIQTQYVKKGDPLVKKLPPEAGRDGKTVTGKTIKPTIGKEIFLRAGRNSYFCDEEQTQLCAAIDGVASIQGGTVHVDGTQLINSNVDKTTGNISFPGNVVILRDVKNGMIVRAGGNIEVNGNVEDALLDASGDIKIKGAFVGEGKGEAYAGGDVHVRKVIQQKIKAGKSVFIHDLARNAKVEAGELISATYYDGIIEGGHLKAHWNVVANVLGNADQTKTTVELATKASTNLISNEIGKKLGTMKTQLDDCKSEIRILESLHSGGVPDPQAIHKIRDLHSRIAQLKFDIGSLEKEEADIEKKMQVMGHPGTIQVRAKLYPGVTIKIDKSKLEIEEAIRSSLFRLDAGLITREVERLETTA